MKYKIREKPIFSACGLNCGLCPRYYTDGSSRCPGCGGEGFSEVYCGCSILPCCERKGIEFCFECDEFPCKKYDKADEYDSFITHKNQLKDLKKAKQIGIEAYITELNEKIGILEKLLQNHNDGRRKSFYCIAVNLLDLHDVKAVMEQIEPEMPVKAVISLFEETAQQRRISLKLRKKQQK